MYEIRPETIKTFITDRNIKLPRFQRKQTWDEKKNFQLCISIFKEYPIGVCILSVDEHQGRPVRWLLDGRQRRNALIQMSEDPENIYNWARKFIGFKNSDQPSQLEEKFRQKINEYIEADADDEFECGGTDDEDNSISIETQEENIPFSVSGLDLLLQIIKIIHNKQKKNTGFTKPFDFSEVIGRLPYFEDGSTALSSRKVRLFIAEYENYASLQNVNYEEEEVFYSFLANRCDILDEKKAQNRVHEKWNEILARIRIVDAIDTQLTNSKIGMIEVKNLTPSDSQKIFNIINSVGEKLKAVEILSAKPHWNIPIANPSADAMDAVRALYKRLNTVTNDVVRWDYPATILRRIGNNCIIGSFSDSNTEFVKELTVGFKIVAGIYEGGVKKESIDMLSRSAKIKWETEFDEFIYDIKNMIRLMSSSEYFRYFQSWKTSLYDITSEAVAVNFFIMAYMDWKRKGKPIGADIKAKQFQKNCFILWDRLIYEYIYKQWRGAADQKTANNINNIKSAPDVYIPVSCEQWQTVLNEIFEKSTIESLDISQALMTPILYHMYCLKRKKGPAGDDSIEVDHIIPQTLFEGSTIPRAKVVQHNLLNLGLLPKGENGSKNNRRLKYIESQWLIDSIVEYEFIPAERFNEFSDVTNYKSMFEYRRPLIEEAFSTDREYLLNN